MKSNLFGTVQVSKAIPARICQYRFGAQLPASCTRRIKSIWRSSRFLKLGMTHPIDTDLVREFAERVDEVYVVEEKRPLLENEVKALLTQMYQDGSIKQYVNVWGQAIPRGFSVGIPAASGLDASILIQKLIPLFKQRLGTRRHRTTNLRKSRRFLLI